MKDAPEFMKRKLTIILLALGIIVPPVLSESAAIPSDEEIADIASSLVQYVKWKNRDYGKINFCTVGLDTVGDAVKKMSIDDFKVIKNPSNTDLPLCHVIYISESEAKNTDEMLWKIKDNDTITISLIKGFAKMGGVIELVIESDKLSFKINVTSAKKAHVIIKSDLLAMAEIVSSE